MYSPCKRVLQVTHLKHQTCHCESNAIKAWPSTISFAQPVHSEIGEKKKEMIFFFSISKQHSSVFFFLIIYWLLSHSRVVDDDVLTPLFETGELGVGLERAGFIGGDGVAVMTGIWTHFGQRTSLPVKVTRSPEGNGCLFTWKKEINNAALENDQFRLFQPSETLEMTAPFSNVFQIKNKKKIYYYLTGAENPLELI